jgi:hypothetical protein
VAASRASHGCSLTSRCVRTWRLTRRDACQTSLPQSSARAQTRPGRRDDNAGSGSERSLILQRSVWQHHTQRAPLGVPS